MPGAEGIQVTAPRLPDAAADLQAALLRYFSGPWRFTRTMRGADELAIGEAVGEALFQPGDANQLRYQESGQLQLANGERPLSFSRRFNYRMEGDTVRVDFADGLQAGQPYQHYRYNPQQKALLPVQTHLCNLDRYDSRYELLDDTHFDLHTRIEGPHKHYLLHTRYCRLHKMAIPSPGEGVLGIVCGPPHLP
ncbi:hypothetical protein HNP33_001140 [Comamonas odontotermitis]|uniref:DUF6314 domain-containing protein n=1 Tax=Comamonas odontotermitis TaxID=379895 RepID=A0ABR6RDH5_9BURK|nr:DUF6314 family protein [Comamonas odontotermitis]MBB6577089.1 hypothetical protein [Comamonas odontotermitis]